MAAEAVSACRVDQNYGKYMFPSNLGCPRRPLSPMPEADEDTRSPLPPASPLWDLPGLLITPHLAGLSPRYGERLAALFARNLAAYRGEGEWVNRVV